MHNLDAMNPPRWTPISENRLYELLDESSQLMTDELRQLWQLIHLRHAEIWQQRPWADEGCGFWVVATFSRSCIYFNDLSQSFALSHFDRWGNIMEFDPTSRSLNELLTSLLAEPQTA